VLLVPILVDTYQSVIHDFQIDLGRYELWATMALPIVLTVGIMRHGLFDITVVLRRATVFTTVSVVALGIYAGAVWLVTTLTNSSRATAALVGAGVVVVTLSQVREAVQHLTARHLFGTRDDPYVTLSALGNRIEATPPGEQALQSVTDSISEQLRVPYAAVDLVLDETVVRVARSGILTEHADTFPLIHRGIALGTLVVGYRTPSEPFRDAERTLLADLARQAGVLAHNASVTEALRHSRAVLLNAREEERRRIRADLHDGLGPTLATVALGLGAAAERLEREPQLAELLTDLEQELQTAIADVRGLVYDLRPAALDDLGLVPAIRQHADNLTRRTSESSRPLRVEIDAPADLDRLPAAVEVAAYRVALEALTNVTRHARASLCRVHIDTAGGLALTVEDDGVGVPERAPLGVGLRSMRERVEELGGRFGVDALTPSGTAVRAWLPLPSPASAAG
jgi:signal transduction histidine kinase